MNGQTWIVNVDEFSPDNVWSTGQILRKTSSGYVWSNESGWGGWGWTNYYAGYGIDINSSNEIINTKPFNPTGWSGTAWQVLTINSQWNYEWMTSMTEANVKHWTINSNTPSSTTLEEIHTWVTANANNWAIIWDIYTSDVFIYHHTTTASGQTNLVFYGVKRSSEKYTSTKWDYTVAWQLKMVITYYNSSYNCIVSRNNDDATVTNYLSVEGSGYTTPFIPTDDYQPTTKKYVDSKEWHGTQTQYNALPSSKLTDGVVYNILPS